MKVDISDILETLNKEDKLHFNNDVLVAIKTDVATQYSCEHLELHFKSGSVIKIDVTTMPSADTAFRYTIKKL